MGKLCLIQGRSRSLGNTEIGMSSSAWNGEEWEEELREGFPEEVIV